MYIITDKENVIIHTSETIGYQENGNILLNNGELAIAKAPNEKIGVYEVETIEEGVTPAKYCYTEEKGFYKNENYREYYSQEDRISALEDTVNIILGF